jgi:hypothetical protein
LTVLAASILTTCAAQRNLCDFINLTIFFFLIKIYSSLFVFILHVPSLSCVGTYIASWWWIVNLFETCRGWLLK